MKKIFALLIFITGLVTGCSDKPLNFSCINTANPDMPESLSIKNGMATLNFMTYKAECQNMGNKVTYAASKEECGLAGSSDKRYSLLVFDNVVFTAYTNSGLGSGNSIQEAYMCKKIN